MLNAGYPLAGDISLGGFRAENITGGNITAAQAFQGWTGDALHLNTLLSPNLTEIGAGVARAGDRYYNDPVIDTSAPSDFIMPIVTSTPDADGLVYHEVQYGQTLWAITIAYGVKIDEFRAFKLELWLPGK